MIIKYGPNGEFEDDVQLEDLKAAAELFDNICAAELTADPPINRDSAAGVEIIKLLSLKVKKNGRVDTAWGDKTPYGLVQVIKRILMEHKSI